MPGVLTHNPMAAAHGPGFKTGWGRHDPYTLDELAEVIPLGWRMPTKPAAISTEAGRNCYLFRVAMRESRNDGSRSFNRAGASAAARLDAWPPPAVMPRSSAPSSGASPCAASPDPTGSRMPACAISSAALSPRRE